MATPRTSNVRAKAIAEGWRSGLEEVTGKDLTSRGVSYTYEQEVIEYLKPARKARYTPDFKLLANGIIVETKGRFVTADRQKHLLVKEQRPDLDIRFVFSNPNTRISKQSKTTYAQWCEKYGFKYAKGRVPQEWVDEKID